MNKTSFSSNEKIKLFGMKNLMLESDLVKLENSGIDLQHKKTLQSPSVVDFELFEIEILKSAQKMSEFYVIYYSIENSIRSFIHDRLKDNHGANWWDTRVPDDLKAEVKKRKEWEVDSPMAIRSEDPLTYVTFGELAKIFSFNWEDFSDTIRSQKALNRVLMQLNQLRGVVAHSCELSEDDIERFQLSVKDWFRILT